MKQGLASFERFAQSTKPALHVKKNLQKTCMARGLVYNYAHILSNA